MGSSNRDDADSSTALLRGAVLDGIPESVVIGITLIGGASVGAPFLAAVFLSNLPESIGSASEARESGTKRGPILRLWAGVAIVSTLATVAGYALLDGASGNVVGTIQGFAAGALIVMLVDTMIPDATRRAGGPTGLFTTLGFAVAALISFTS